MAVNNLTAQRLRELFSYDPSSGAFCRLTQRGPSRPGPVSMCLDTHGYPVMRVDYKLYRAHRLAWLHATGAWPMHDIDHIDGNRSNNRLANLRDVTRGENCQNLRAAQSHSDHGVLGVSRTNKSTTWRARIAVNGRTVYLGCFETQAEAQAAYLRAKRELHPANTL
jgi:hypothetical protein